ncbi:MAG TPA: chemotaxis protein CheB [Tepidisphaeraceae bacterium]|jgi:two-component system chemotaxis response regulator CheB|nr:chemotaxis protein CheB [Tepidisphaeraceae bacterium]
MSRSKSSNGIGRDIIVIGASAGGVQALRELVRGLPADLRAAIFVAVHASPSSPGVLPQILQRAGHLPASHAEDGEKIRHGRIYVAPPDFHLLLKPGFVQVTRGPKENGFRPAADSLFRTAARAYGQRVVGIVLTGSLDDGTVGLIHIKHEGGIAIVQEPSEAVFPSMPQSAIDNVRIDHILSVAEMPALLSRLSTQPLPHGARTMSKRTNGRPDVAEVGKALLLETQAQEPPTSITCPECGGALWERKDGNVFRYQCHVGHSYTDQSLVAEKNDQLESILWTALRALEENASLRRRMARRAATGPAALQYMARGYLQQATEAQDRAAVLREALTNGIAAQVLADKTNSQKKAKSARSQSVKQAPKKKSKTIRLRNVHKW